MAKQHKFETAEVVRTDTARILEIDFYPHEESIVVRFGAGTLDEKNRFTVRPGSEKSVRVSGDYIPASVRAVLDSLDDAVFAMLVERGALPAGSAEPVPAIVPDPEPEPETPDTEAATEPAPAPRTARTPRRTA